jgi:hypothetical protein
MISLTELFQTIEQERKDHRLGVMESIHQLRGLCSSGARGGTEKSHDSHRRSSPALMNL